MAGDGQRRYQYAAADPVNGMDPSGNFVLESYWPLVPIPIPWQPHLNWCDIPVILPSNMNNELLPPCPLPPFHCKKCFNTSAFAQTMDSLTAGNNPQTTGKPSCPTCTGTYCAAYVSLGLQAGGVNISGRPNYAGDYGPFLEGHEFSAIATIQFPRQSSVIGNARQGDITVFGKTTKHNIGHIEGFDGKGWVSYWQQQRWYPYSYNPKAPLSKQFPAGPATIYRSKCPCGQ